MQPPSKSRPIPKTGRSTRTSANRIRANRRNARKSTGPKSTEGKARSRMNALKHGLDAKTAILPGEDASAYHARLDAWKTDVAPRTPEEESLIEEAARLSWQLDRADRAQAAHAAMQHEAGTQESARRQAEADALGQQLVAGPPIVPCPTRELEEALAGKRFRAHLHPDDPGHPGQILRRLHATAEGCQWLQERWSELWLALRPEDQAGWTADRRLLAVRLLGGQPADAEHDPKIRRIYLCSFALGPMDTTVFNDQVLEMTKRDFAIFLERLRSHRASAEVPRDPNTARAGLIDLVEHEIVNLQIRSDRHADRAATAPERLAIDDTPEGDRLRRLHLRITNALFRTIDRLTTLRGRHTETIAATPAEAVPCDELRNEPNAPPPAATPGDGNPTPAPAIRPKSLDATSESKTVCNQHRNEPNIDAPEPASLAFTLSGSSPCLCVSVVQITDPPSPIQPPVPPNQAQPPPPADVASPESPARPPRPRPRPGRPPRRVRRPQGTFHRPAPSKERERGFGPSSDGSGPARTRAERPARPPARGNLATSPDRLAPGVPDLLDFSREIQGAGFTGTRPIPATRTEQPTEVLPRPRPQIPTAPGPGDPEGV